MKTTLIRFHTSDYLRLDGLLYEPDIKTDKVIIHVHGSMSDFYRTRYFETFSQQFTDSGYAFLTFNNRGSGLNYRFYKEKGNKRIATETIGTLNEIFEDCTLDIDAAITLAKNKGFTEIILQGHSYGCNKVTWYTIDKNYDGKIILLAPCDVGRDRKSGIERKVRDKANLDMFRYRDKTFMLPLQNLKNKILVQIGTDDEYIVQQNKQECADYLKDAFKNAQLHTDLIDDANHNYDDKYLEVAINIISWLSSR